MMDVITRRRALLQPIKNLRQTVEGRMFLTFVVTILLLGAGTLAAGIANAHPANADIEREWAMWPVQNADEIGFSDETVTADSVVEVTRPRNSAADSFRWNKSAPYRMRCAR